MATPLDLTALSPNDIWYITTHEDISTQLLPAQNNNVYQYQSDHINQKASLNIVLSFNSNLFIFKRWGDGNTVLYMSSVVPLTFNLSAGGHVNSIPSSNEKKNYKKKWFERTSNALIASKPSELKLQKNNKMSSTEDISTRQTDSMAGRVYTSRAKP
jgi:hypothetical protein